MTYGLYRKAGDKVRAVIYTITKRDYVRSEPLRLAYRTIACQSCGRDDGTVCGAHSNWAIHGKGKGIKADDNRGASMCSACHAEIDQGSKLTEDERKAKWWKAHVRTVALLTELGRWPPKVPQPDVLTCPWPHLYSPELFV